MIFFCVKFVFYLYRYCWILKLDVAYLFYEFMIIMEMPLSSKDYIYSFYGLSISKRVYNITKKRFIMGMELQTYFSVPMGAFWQYTFSGYYGSLLYILKLCRCHVSLFHYRLGLHIGKQTKNYISYSLCIMKNSFMTNSII